VEEAEAKLLGNESIGIERLLTENPEGYINLGSA
jgi:hypothetical protein